MKVLQLMKMIAKSEEPGEEIGVVEFVEIDDVDFGMTMVSVELTMMELKILECELEVDALEVEAVV